VAGLTVHRIGIALEAAVVAIVTNHAGYFTLNNVAAGPCTSTPAQTGKTFTPKSKTVAVTNAYVTAVNFVGSAKRRCLIYVVNIKEWLHAQVAKAGNVLATAIKSAAVINDDLSELNFVEN